MAAVDLSGVSVRFGDFDAVREVSVHINDGTFFSFLGPSGCGKTTLLRAVSGFAEPSAGTIRIGDQDMRGIGPHKRPTALVFQNLALFPLMPVWQNIAFALEVRGVRRAARRKRAEELLELIAMPGHGDRLCSELSGGQRQRVAIARALAAAPAVLLLDEPLSALDRNLREHMRGELRAIQQRVGITFIYITHDQGEALAMSDQVAVMRAGTIEQVADPRTLYDQPRSAFVASFVGENNMIPGTVAALEPACATVETAMGPLKAKRDERLRVGDPAYVFTRPEALRLGPPEGGGNGENRFPATVAAKEFEGHLWRYFLHLRGELRATAVRVQGAPDAPDDDTAAVGVEIPPHRAIALPTGPLASE